MLPLLVPILAQAVTLGLADRTEARRDTVVVQGTPAQSTTVGWTGPSAWLNIDWRHFGIATTYNPSFTLEPLLTGPRHVYASQVGALRLLFRQTIKHTTITVSEVGAYTQQNLQQNALAAPPLPLAPGPQNDQGTGKTDPNQKTDPTMKDQPAQSGTAVNAAAQRTVPTAYQGDQRLAIFTTNAQVVQQLSRTSTLGAAFIYTLSTGLDAATRKNYPLVSTETGSLFSTYTVTRRDILGANLTVSHSATPDGAISWISTATSNYNRRWGRHTTTFIGAGVSATYTLTPLPPWPGKLGLVGIYPTFGLGFSQFEKVGRGDLTLSATAAAAPSLDVLTATVDPRIGLVLLLSWTRKQFRASLVGSGVISVNQVAARDSSSLNSIYASAQVGYLLGSGFLVDAGLRTAWQTLGGAPLVSPTWTVFVGITWADTIQVRRPH